MNRDTVTTSVKIQGKETWKEIKMLCLQQEITAQSLINRLLREWLGKQKRA